MMGCSANVFTVAAIGGNSRFLSEFYVSSSTTIPIVHDIQLRFQRMPVPYASPPPCEPLKQHLHHKRLGLSLAKLSIGPVTNVGDLPLDR